MRINFIEEEDKILSFLLSRWLLKQYQKSKKLLLWWYMHQVNFKIREPKKDQIYYFRINKQFRAWCYFEWDKLVVFRIDNHQ